MLKNICKKDATPTSFLKACRMLLLLAQSQKSIEIKKNAHWGRVPPCDIELANARKVARIQPLRYLLRTHQLVHDSRTSARMRSLHF